MTQGPPPASEAGRQEQRSTDDRSSDSAGTVVNDVEAGTGSPTNDHTREKSKLESEKSKQNLVDWDGPDDPRNPLNFSSARKWLIILVVGSATLCVTCTSSMVASTYGGMEREFGVSREVATLGLTLFIGGLGLGPLFLAPLSEFYGRTPVYLVGYFVYSAFAFLVAFGNFPGLLVGRFIQGVAGSAFLSVAGGSVTDMWAGPKVGRPMSLYTACPFLGPVLGPIMASFINQGANWRWTWYVCLIWTWVELVLVALFVPETYAPAILRKKAKRLRKETGNQTLRSQRENHEEAMGISIPRYVASSMGRPFEILLREIMALLLCLWCALLLGILYAFFSAFPIIFSAKGFNEGEVGLAFVGIGIGICLATLIDSTYWTSSYVKLAHKLGHKPPPEAHLRKGMVAAVIGPISLFWFAWTCQPSVHWAIPIVASGFFGVAYTWAFTASFTYKVDAYRPYAASAMGANSFLRSAFAAAFPLFTVQMYEHLTPEWAGTLVAFLLLAITPAPFLFYKYGARLRKRSKFSDTQ